MMTMVMGEVSTGTDARATVSARDLGHSVDENQVPPPAYEA